MNNTIIGQIHWPYTFHIAALTIFAWSYLFYFQKKWTLWFVSLVLFTLQKEEFGFYAASFGFLLGLDALLDKSLEERKKASVFAISIILIGVLNYFQFIQFVAIKYEGVGQFALKFPMFGATPKEALHTLFVDPKRYWDAMTRPSALSYFYFFIVTSLIWRFPRWSVLKYMLPVAPMIFINGISNMNVLNQHYALPTAVGIAATVILGVFNYGFKNGNTYRAHAVLLLGFVILPWYGLESPFRALRTGIELWPERKESVERVSVLDQQKDLILCCDYELCTRFTERALFLPTPFCQKGSPLLDEHVGKKAVYLVLTNSKKSDEQDTSSSAFLPWPEESSQWEYESAFLKLSKPILISKSKMKAAQQ